MICSIIIVGQQDKLFTTTTPKSNGKQTVNTRVHFSVKREK